MSVSYHALAEPLAPVLAAAVERHRDDRGPLLPILHDLQAERGWIEPEATVLLAKALNLSRAEVHGVITFYRDFRHHPPAAVDVRLCRGEACQANGCEALVVAVEERLGLRIGEEAADQSVALHEVFCLGNCALGPSALVGGRLIGRLDADGVDAAIRRAASDLAVPDLAGKRGVGG